ncbi:hypothetical protein RvY_18752 [Ramazzottius varieornatus]|uniref:Uncharacterized protein n=1 Tax=Ramazzottius varieornatus TaxID=947166 RepID=A0A1D1W6W3_RAMVA|nr:hypothetical protein RvY_18752 [Ramazzottius varieornatus]
MLTLSRTSSKFMLTSRRPNDESVRWTFVGSTWKQNSLKKRSAKTVIHLYLPSTTKFFETTMLLRDKHLSKLRLSIDAFLPKRTRNFLTFENHLDKQRGMTGGKNSASSFIVKLGILEELTSEKCSLVKHL